MLAEQQTEWIISNNLVNKGWHIDNGTNKNVYLQKPKTKGEQIKLNGKRADYILYRSDTGKPIAIIEAKKAGKDLNAALEQATEYARLLDVPIIFASNGAYCATRFVPTNKPLILNGEEVKELLSEKEILAFTESNSNEAWTIPQEVKVSREELISIFKNLNGLLRSEGIRAGIERFNEFANILFLKLLSEGNKKSWWNTIKNQSNDDIIGYINSYVIEQIKNKYGGDVFTPISIGNPQTIRHIIDAIDPLVLSTIDTDIKGDAFEYFLEKTTSTENDLGEYFTPRNIVKTIINLVDPKFKETIYDPFCGTGGFLTEAFNYVKDNNIINNKEDLEILKHHTLYGRELTKTARIAKMNMILHGDGHSGIQQINSLENPDYISPITKECIKFDIIVTNMPFSQGITTKMIQNNKTVTENHIAPLYYNGISKNNGDAACVLHCLQSLKEGGRMALVVPEGFLFRKDTSAIRQFLLSKAKLQAVISLPQGTFLPYTGVKTSILYFTDAHKPNNQKEYWFYEVKNIGVTLDNKKRKIKGINDLDKIHSSDINKISKNPRVKDNMLELGFEIIDLEKVKNNNYNLIGNHYREIKKQMRKWSMVSIKSLIESKVIIAKKGKTITKKRVISGDIPVIAGGQTSPYSHSEFTDKGNIITISASGAYSGFVWYHDYPIWASDCSVLYSKDETVLLTKYLYNTLKHLQEEIYKMQKGAGQPHIYIKDIENLTIPIPSLEEQQKIVEEMDSYQKVIDGAKQIIDNWKPYFEINTSWKLFKIKDICEINPSKHCGDLVECSFLPMEDMNSNKLYTFPKKIKEVKEVKNGYTFFKANDLLIAKITPCFENNKMSIVRNLVNDIGFGSTEFIVVRAKNGVHIEWVYHCLQTLNFINDGASVMTGSVGHKRVSIDFIVNYSIPLPPIETQEKILHDLIGERHIIENQENIIKLFENKLKSRLNALWQSEKEDEPTAVETQYGIKSEKP